MAARLFGTDGVRGAYGSVLSVDLALRLRSVALPASLRMLSVREH